jgi:hypothetical protein
MLNTFRPVPSSQTTAVWSAEADTSNRPSWENCRARTSWLWPRSRAFSVKVAAS